MQTQRLRRFALHVLLAWVFAFATGVVNACVMQVHLPGSGHVVGHGGQALTDADYSMSDEADCLDHGSQAGKPPSDRCCDEPSALPQQAAKQQSDSPGFFLAALPAPAFTHQFAAARAARLDSSRLRWGATIPIPIAFLRLAL